MNHRITIPFDAMVGKTVERIEVLADESLSIIVTFTDGTALWADDPTVYGDSEPAGHSVNVDKALTRAFGEPGSVTKIELDPSIEEELR